MQPWAQRIQTLLLAGKPRKLTQTGLAKACGIAQPSVNQWFNATDKKPPTEMIRGDNLVAAAKYLGTTPQWIITGKDDHSQLERLDASIILQTISRMRETTEDVEGEAVDVEADPELFAEMLRLTILETMESSDGERGIRATGGPGGRTAGPAGKEEDGEAARPATGRRRKAG